MATTLPVFKLLACAVVGVTWMDTHILNKWFRWRSAKTRVPFACLMVLAHCWVFLGAAS